MFSVPSLTFNTPTRLDPTNRDNAFSCHEPPLDRTHKSIMKAGTAGIDGMWTQEFDPVLGWRPEINLSSQNSNADGQQRHDYNRYGDVLYVYLEWDAGAAAFYLHGLWKDGQGVYTDIDQRIDPAAAGAGPNLVGGYRFGVTAIDDTRRDFWVFYQKYDGGAVGDLWGCKFNGSTRTWSASVNYGRPGGGNIGVAGPCAASWQPLDDSIHIAIAASVNALPSGLDVYYLRYDLTTSTMGPWNRLTTIVPPGELMCGAVGNELDAIVDTQNKDQFYIVATHWTSNPNWDLCEIYFFEKDLTASPPAWKAPVRISAAATRGAHSPTIICDTNGDVYVVFEEHDPVAVKNAVWVTQRKYPFATWATQKVADSNYATSPAMADPDPEHPGIVRPPRYRPLINLCITWGDKVAGGGGNPYVYVSCALVRTEADLEALFEEGAGGTLVNHHLRMFDIPAGGQWWRGLGKDDAA